jgi:phosphatidylinositol 4-kinase
LAGHTIDALGVIAEKTPALVLEGANDYVDSDLEYNSVLRKDFAASVSPANGMSLFCS